MNIEEIRKKIDKFMRWKAERIEQLLPRGSGIQYYTAYDAEAIKKLDREAVIRIYLHFKVIAYGTVTINRDSDHCPFCVIYLPTCAYCPYAKDHLVCRDKNSDYSAILFLLGCSISRALGKEWITAKIQQLF